MLWMKDILIRGVTYSIFQDIEYPGLLICKPAIDFCTFAAV